MIVFCSICNIAQSFKYIRKYDPFYFISNSTASKTTSQEHYMEIIFCDAFFGSSINISKKFAAIIEIRIRTMTYFFIIKF